MNSSKTLGRLALLLGLFALPACGADGQTAEEDTEQSTSAVVSGANGVVTNEDFTASETASLINVNGSTKTHVIAFNFSDDENVSFSQDNRWIYPGASLAGWARATAAATNEVFGTGRLVPPPGWPVLWGDPGLAQIPNTGFVFATTVALPQHKMPAEGFIKGSIAQYLGGACVGRSTDGGSTFTVQSSDCLHDDTYDFWDGTSIAGSAAGKVLAAFNDQNGNNVHHLTTWYASSPTAAFVDKGDPLITGISGHPRVMAFGQDFFLIVASGSTLSLVPLWWDPVAGHTWGTPVDVARDYDDREFTLGNTLFVRRRSGAQFAMAGFSPFGAPSRIRVVYAAFTDHPILKAAECVLAPSLSCSNQPNAAIDRGPGIGLFHPAMASATKFNGGWTPSTQYTKISWLQQAAAGSNQVELWSANWGQPPRRETPAQTPCPDLRGYWGDYDTGMGVYQATVSDVPRFWRAFTDSTDPNAQSACNFRAQFTSAPVHVSAKSIAAN